MGQHHQALPWGPPALTAQCSSTRPVGDTSRTDPYCPKHPGTAPELGGSDNLTAPRRLETVFSLQWLWGRQDPPCATQTPPVFKLRHLPGGLVRGDWRAASAGGLRACAVGSSGELTGPGGSRKRVHDAPRCIVQFLLGTTFLAVQTERAPPQDAARLPRRRGYSVWICIDRDGLSLRHKVHVGRNLPACFYLQCVRGSR